MYIAILDVKNAEVNSHQFRGIKLGITNGNTVDNFTFEL